MAYVNIAGRGIVVALATACLSLAASAAADATTYCVNQPACVAGGGTEEKGANGEALQKALTAAKGSQGPSTVIIGAGEYVREKGFEYTGSETVAIEGAGEGKTVLTSGTKNATVFALASAKSTLENLSIRVPAGESLQGVRLESGTVEHVAITGGGEHFATGLSIIGGVFTHGSIEMVESGVADQGINLEGGEVLGSTIVGEYGVQGATAGTLRGCRISARITAFDSYYSKTTIEDTLIDLQGVAFYGVSIGANANGNSEATLRNLTIVNGDPNSVGVHVEANKGKSAAVAIESSIITGVGHPIVEHTEEAASTTPVTTKYSSYETSGDEQTTAAGGTVPAAPADENPASTTADFVHPVAGEHGLTEGNWHLTPGSPLIDAGKPGGLTAGEYEFDAEGDARIVNGHRDVGAYEYQRRAPTVNANASSTTAKIGESITFTGSASDSEPGDTIASYQWTFDEGTSASAGVTATHSFATVGTHKATLTVTDAAGVSASTVVSITVEPAPSIHPCGGCSIHPCGGCRCHCGNLVRSRLSSLRLTPNTFTPTVSGASVTTKRHVGVRVSFVLSRHAPVQFTVEMLVPGFTHGRACLAVRIGHDRGRCMRRVKVRGSFSREGSRGANSFRFTGRIGGNALAPGRYLLAATARSGNTETAPFTIE